MKKIFSIIAVFLLIILSVKAQWKQTYLWPSQEMRLISVVNDNIVWVKDSYGSKISITTDGGNIWTTKDLPSLFLSANTVGGISAINESTAYQIISYEAGIGIYKTTDAGASWIKQTSGFSTTNSFADFIYFWNENEGVVVGDGSSELKFEIYTTSDGGGTWMPVQASSMPAGVGEYTLNTNNVFRVHGNNIYFLTNSGKIMKSANKGVSWSEINTPLTSFNGASFDFKDDSNGLLTFSPTGQVFVTSDGGNTWTQVSISTLVGDVKYSPANSAYLSASMKSGYSYSTDNGSTWTQNQTFNKLGLGMIDVTSNGKVFIGGQGSLFFTPNYLSEQIAVRNVLLTGKNSIGVSYTSEPYLSYSIDTANYQLSSIRLGIATKVTIKNIVQDAVDKTLMRVNLINDLPNDSIRLVIKDIYGLNGTAKGDPMLYNEPGSTTYFKNYSNSKTVNVSTPGALWNLVTALDKIRISQLVVTGSIDARDFRIMRDSLTAVNVFDLSGATIAAYTGTEGTYTTNTIVYNANEIPRQAFLNKRGVALSTMILPSSLISIGRSAFNSITGLTSIVIPSGVASVGQYAFLGCSKLQNLSIPSTITSIGLGAFANCVGLSSVHVYGSTPFVLPVVSNSNNDVFYGVPTATCVLSVPFGSASLYKLANQWSSFSHIISDYTSAKYAIIGSSYFLDNIVGGTQASWNICWRDANNNIQPSAPTLTGNGLIYNWNFPGVYLDGANQGMFKFCIPNSDLTPNWTITPVGFTEITNYSGDAISDVDRISDVGGAFTILTNGLVKKYDLQLSVDQTTGTDVFSLKVSFSNATGVELINESALIVQYSAYTTLGQLVSSGSYASGLTMKRLKQNLSVGTYIVKAKLSNGSVKNYKVRIQ